MSTNTEASIRARLLNRARTEGTEFQLYLVRYACERFLYRLEASTARDHCILKGAGLLAVWMEEPYRATRDIDILAFGANDVEAIRAMMSTICNVPCPEDGLLFDIDTLDVSAIRDDQRYEGQRARIRALLGTARITVQVDFGFGDAVTPGPGDAWLPTLIAGLPEPFLRTYPKVSAIAEKFESMVHLEIRNSRMKDFYDIWALSETFAFEGFELQQAVERCFERRGTSWTAETPDALTSEFYSDINLRSRWTDYGRQGGLLKPPPIAFEDIGVRMRSFIGPVRDAILSAMPFARHWPAGGPWQSSATAHG